MEYKNILKKALSVRQKFSKYEIIKNGKEWTREQILQGFIVDVGDLVRLCMSKEGYRQTENVDEKLAHELSDCLWCILVLSHKYNIDLEKSFMKNMNNLEEFIETKLK